MLQNASLRSPDVFLQDLRGCLSVLSDEGRADFSAVLLLLWEAPDRHLRISHPQSRAIQKEPVNEVVQPPIA